MKNDLHIISNFSKQTINDLLFQKRREMLRRTKSADWTNFQYNLIESEKNHWKSPFFCHFSWFEEFI